MNKPSKILVVEDDGLVRETLAAVVEEAGYEVTTAEDGESGLACLRAGDFDLVLSDIRMPRMDGFELFTRMQADSALAFTPVIFLSALASENDIRQGMALGATDYITKPADPVELLRVIQTRLQQKHRMDSLVAAHEVFISRYLPHELRTPLNGVMGFADLMIQLGQGGTGLSAEETRDYGQHIMVSGKRLLRLADSLLLLVQLSSDKSIPPEPENSLAWIPAMRNQARQLAQDYAREHDLSIDLEGCGVAICERLLCSALLQLVDNALKFSAQGKRVVIVGRLHDDGYELRIRDQGRGMSLEQIDAIGLFRQHDRQVHEQQGLGVGLEIVRRFAARFALDFRLEPNPDGTGLTAVLRIPDRLLHRSAAKISF